MKHTTLVALIVTGSLLTGTMGFAQDTDLDTDTDTTTETSSNTNVKTTTPKKASTDTPTANETSTAPTGGMPFIGLGLEVDRVFASGFASIAGANVSLDHSLYIPINVTPSLRIEPLLTFGHSSTTKYTKDSDANVEVTQDESTTTLGLGVGGFFMWGLTDNITAYGGGRFVFTRVSSSQSTETNSPGNSNTMTVNSSTNNFLLGGAIGTEWYFTKYLSLGGEGQLNFAYRGTPTTELEPNPGGNDDDENTDTALNIAPNVEVFFRWYFM